MNKRIYLLLFLIILLCKKSTSQILCINCYDQNDSISQNVNNLLVNGSFENTTCAPYPSSDVFCPSSMYYSCNISNWLCTGGGNNTYSYIFDSNSTKVVDGIKAVYFGNWNCLACSNSIGDDSCLSLGSCSTVAPPSGYPLSEPQYGGNAGLSLEQTVNGLIIGDAYVLEFWAGGESVYTEEGLFAVDIGFGNTFLRNPPILSPAIGRIFVIQFVATSTSHTIKFTNWEHISSFATELVIDNVRLYTISQLDTSVTPCINTGTNEDNVYPSLSLFPNPISDRLYISNSDNELSEIILYDISSRKILQQKFTKSVSINTEQLVKGIYLYEVRCGNSLCKKGMIEKN